MPPTAESVLLQRRPVSGQSRAHSCSCPTHPLVWVGQLVLTTTDTWWERLQICAQRWLLRDIWWTAPIWTWNFSISTKNLASTAIRSSLMPVKSFLRWNMKVWRKGRILTLERRIRLAWQRKCKKSLSFTLWMTRIKDWLLNWLFLPSNVSKSLFFYLKDD